jgi:sugar fermentation stimulation protein A
MVTYPLPPLERGRLVERPNRFLALVELAGKEVRAHVADPGRLKELLFPGAPVYLALATRPGRSTGYDLRLVEGPQGLVSVDSRVPNHLTARALANGVWPEFAAYNNIKAEPRIQGGRFDFLLTASGLPDCYIEVKGCTLVKEGTALFPDAPTVRGARHVRELAELKAQGNRAAIIFIIQRADAERFAPHTSMDPAFSTALAAAAGAGVEVHAYRSHVSLEEITLAGRVAVLL